MTTNAPYLLCNLHRFFPPFFIYLEILTIVLHIVHNLFTFRKYNLIIESQAKCRVTITHIDNFFHNSLGAERRLGTPHFMGKIPEPQANGSAHQKEHTAASAYSFRHEAVFSFSISNPLPPARYVKSPHSETSSWRPEPQPSARIPQAVP